MLVRLVPRESAVGPFVLLTQRIDDLSREVARRQQVEQELRDQRGWLQVTLASIGDGVVATDADGCVRLLNPTAEALTGWPFAEAVGRPLEDILHVVHEETRAPVANPLTAVLADAAPAALPDHTVLIARDGRERPIDDSAAPIRDVDGRVVGAVLVFHDVSDRRRLEGELRERADRLADAARRKDEWLAMLAHELRGPLAPIRNSVQVVRLHAGPAVELRQATDVITRQVGHLARLIDDLLDVSRLTGGQMQLSTERLDLARLVRAAADDFRAELERAGLTLTVRVPPTPAWVQGDASRLTQVLHNLLDNARKFTDRGGRVDVCLEADAAGRAAVHVGDSGAGIDLDMVGRLFQPLSQADRSLHRSRGGLGLGLALVKGLTELHGGSVEARSGGPGCGTEFVVRLPLEPEPAALEAEADVGPLTGPRRRILIIEDNRDAADSLHLLLTFLGHNVRVAYSGPDGVQEAVDWRPEVILSDIGLPGLDGYGVARALRQNPATATARLIAITGYGQKDDHRLARESGFDHVMTKPAEPAVLLELLADDGAPWRPADPPS
ncbi:MAG: ATP-binding protein [Gemmataceae bacterium]